MHKLNKTFKKFINQNLSLAIGLALLATSVGIAVSSPQTASAACSVTTATYGSVSYNTTVKTSGTYKVAVRMKASGTNNTVAVDVGDNCNMTVGGSSVSATTWTWVSAPNNVNLTAGANISVILRGIAPGVQVDRVLLMTNTTCAPTGTGDNCNFPDDTTLPNVSITAPTAGANVQGTTTTISANATDDTAISKVEFYRGGTTLLASDTTSPYSTSWNTTTVVDGSYSLTAKAFDTSNNVRTSTAIAVNVANNPPPPPVDGILPTVPTNLSATVANGTSAPQVNLTWTASTDNVAVTAYDIYKGGSLLKSVPSNATSDTAVAIGQTYSYYVVAKDGSGNKSPNSATVTVTIPDTIAPTVTITSPSAGATVSGTIDVNINAIDNVGVERVQMTVDNVVAPDDTAAPYTFKLNTLGFSNGPHTISVGALDKVGNRGTTSISVNVQNGDTTAPTAPGNFRATAPASNRVDLTWTASTDASGIKDYLLTKNGDWVGLMGPNATSYTDTAVLASTTYNYELIAIDNADNIAGSTTSVTTPAGTIVDNQAPSVPGNLTASAVSTSQINLSWAASTDNVGVKHYEISRNGVKLDTVTTTSYGDTGLTADTSYSYTVKAVDAALNASAASNTATARTQATTGKTNVALNKPATSSSIQSANYVAANAFDTSLTTRWASVLSADGNSGKDPEWIYVDLGSSYTVSGAKLTWEAAYATAYQLQVSNDATNWTTIYSTTSGNGGTDDITASGAGRYVRMNGTARGTQWGYSLYDMQVFGSNPTTPPPPSITTGSISGLVTSSSTNGPLAGVYVSVSYNGTRHRNRTATDGVYTLDNIPQGTYEFRYYRRGYAEKRVQYTIIGGTTLRDANVTMVKN